VFAIEAIRESARRVAEWLGAKFIPKSPFARVSQIPTGSVSRLSSMCDWEEQTARTHARMHARITEKLG